jgi:hypothetical protein
MSYDIHSNCSSKSFKCNNAAWPRYLQLARAFGWRPAGVTHFIAWTENGPKLTEIPDGQGSYFYNDWQQVTDVDARELAKALRRAAAAVDERSPLTENQYQNLKAFAGRGDDDVFIGLVPQQGAADWQGIAGVDLRGVLALSDLAGEGGFTIA